MAVYRTKSKDPNEKPFIASYPLFLFFFLIGLISTVTTIFISRDIKIPVPTIIAVYTATIVILFLINRSQKRK
ncbi:hypothetical protein [Planococcus sp. 107-1]|uniref:hypothetical protein n=1 Tax=Planococcus sp. 107-1 TaxID=2908840 RepID=UPI001F46F142|nr:hypothetical protein [Planococcus sp. 107-1]UJF27677.1 hypothetical protein L0M13_04230 [Planococcus sp. 107-1]